MRPPGGIGFAQHKGESPLPPTKAPPAANRLLAALPRQERVRFLSRCEPIELRFGEALTDSGAAFRHVYFPTQSLICLTTAGDGRSSLEVGLIGDEGMLGVSLILDTEVSPLHAVVQGPGLAQRMEIAPFRLELARSPVLQRVLKRYLYVVMGQLAQAVSCARFHVLEARLARWLLMTQDRAHSNQFHVTHEFLSHMLGVRRVGVTRAANSLQRRELISYRRGNITILDRRGLEAASCSCYAADKAAYTRIMG